MTEQMTVEEWLAVRRAEGRKIDPATAEVEAIYFGIKRSVTLSITPR